MTELKSNPSDRVFTSLRDAAADAAAYAYVTLSLQKTLLDIGHSNSLVLSILGLLSQLRDDHPMNAAIWNAACQGVIREYHSELDRIYSTNYEEHRKEFFSDFVFPVLRQYAGPRLLDLGCGRGFVSRWIAESSISHKVVGIDPVDFSAHWSVAAKGIPGTQLSYDRVLMNEQRDWFAKNGPFDTVFASWVFHHSTQEECEATMTALHHSIAPTGRVIILEDAAVPGQLPEHDPFGFGVRWAAYDAAESALPTETQHRIQALLDFIAVRILARYIFVDMDFDYRTSVGWSALFQSYGFDLISSHYVGFPAKRDIAVPQSVMVFGLRD